MGNIINWFNEFSRLNPNIKIFYVSQKPVPSLDETNINYIHNEKVMNGDYRSIVWYVDNENKIKYAMAIDKSSLILVMKYFNQLNTILKK